MNLKQQHHYESLSLKIMQRGVNASKKGVGGAATSYERAVGLINFVNINFSFNFHTNYLPNTIFAADNKFMATTKQ